jgi:hypothetical protein
LLITSVIVDARNFQITAIAKISAPTLETRAVMAAMPTDADALPLLPLGNACAHFINDSRYFVSRNAGILKSRPTAL